MKNTADNLRSQHPNQPWMWRSDWADKTIKSSNRTAMFSIGFMALIWNAVSWPVALLIVPDELKMGNYPAILALLFPAVGLFLFGWATVLFRRFRKYGESTFELASVPGVIGGTVAGVIHTNRKLTAESGFKQQLSCIEFTRNRGKQANTRRVLWQTDRVIDRELTSSVSKSAIPVHFDIPFDAQPTSSEGRRSIHWKVEVRAESPGVDYHAEFEIPVFVTEESSADFQPSDTGISEFTRESSAATACSEAKIERHETMDGVDYTFPLLRHIGASLVMTLVATFWWSVLLVMAHACLSEGMFGVVAGFGVLLFGLIGLLIVAGMLDLWLWKSRIRVTPESFSYRSGLLGIGHWHSIPRSEIANVSMKSSGQNGQQLSYDLSLTTEDGAKHRFGKRVSGKSAATAIAGEICELLSIAEPTIAPTKSRQPANS